MSTSEEIIVNAVLAGVREYNANAASVAASNEEMAASTKMVGDAAATTTKRSYLMNQAMFTVRRLMYGTTLAVLGLGIEATKMGFNFDKGMQVARVSMKGFLPTTQAVNEELNRLYNFAAYTPFQFQDIVLATRKILPFVDNVKTANQLIHDLVDSLAAMGLTTGAALNRGALALNHMLSLGRVTGLTVNQLTRDNIPLLLALAKYYGVTTEQIREMVKQGLIPATAGIKALHQYITTTPGYINAAMKIATKSLTGAFTTFKDIIMKSFGSAEGGLFSGLQHILQGVDVALAPLLAGGKNISLYQLAQAFDQVLSPKTHTVIYLFTLFKGVLDGVIFDIHLLSKALSIVLYPLDLFSHGGGDAQWVMHLFGLAIGTAIVLLGLYKTGLMIAVVAQTLWTAATKVGAAATFLYEVWILRAEYAQLLLSKAQVVGAVIMGIWEAATLLGAEAVTALTLAILANPFAWLAGLIVLVVAGLVILYFKWKFFHDLVNNTFNWVVSHWKLLAALLVAPFAVAAYEIYKHWDTIKKYVEDVYNWIVKKIHTITGLFGRLYDHIPGHGLISGALHLIPGLASGGTVTNQGLTWVGESGPELLSLPRGASVLPLDDSARKGGMMSGILENLVLKIDPADIHMDGKKVGNIVFKHYSLAKAHA